MHSLHALCVLGVGPACLPASMAMAFFAGFQGLGRHGAVCYLWFSQLLFHVIVGVGVLVLWGKRMDILIAFLSCS